LPFRPGHGWGRLRSISNRMLPAGYVVKFSEVERGVGRSAGRIVGARKAVVSGTGVVLLYSSTVQ
jgi:hypothetical protein